MPTDDLRRAIEAIKLRIPIEDLVRERVPLLKKSGNLWVACCPFHEEKTPSFKVDPRRGTWHCFGACGTGGDQISFVERFDRLAFMDAIEILAARAGVDLPKSKGTRLDLDANRDGLDLLERAARFFTQQLATPEGRAAVDYQRARGLSDATASAFGTGYAPANGQVLVRALQAKHVDLGLAESVGLVRRNDQGRPYDFFRGRWMIPIRDGVGRTVGFGGRRLVDDEVSGPKYVNTPETSLFHKGRLIYALDRALPHVRKSGHVILVEGYTDVMAAHQAGVETVVAVLGTATTDDHAGMIRKSGARRVSLVFDGDEAGRKAAYKGLHGLLPLPVEIDVVSLTGGIDPCDLVLRDGREAFEAEVARARGWFDFVCDGLGEHRGLRLVEEIDRALELLARLSKPVLRDELLVVLATRLGTTPEILREQSRTLPQRRTSAPVAPVVPARRPAGDPRITAAFEQAIGAVLCDPCLMIPSVRDAIARTDDPELARIFELLVELCGDEALTLNAENVVAQLLTAMGDDPARERAVKIHLFASTADSPQELLNGQLRTLEMLEFQRESRENQEAIARAEQDAAMRGDLHGASSAEAIELSKRTPEILQRGRELQAR